MKNTFGGAEEQGEGTCPVVLVVAEGGESGRGGGVNRRPELKTKGSEGVCDRGGEVIFCSVVSFQKGLAGRSCCETGRVGGNR